MSRRLLFVCYPDTNHPIGGVKQIYRQVELLAAAGLEAWVLQQEPGFRATWFESSAPVLNLASYLASGPNADRDLIVLPETWLTNVPSYLVGIPKVIFNQNAFYTFGLEGRCDERTLELYQHPDIVGVVTVSDDSRELLVRGCGVAAERCHSVLNGIDPELFHVPDIKVRRIVYMGRKQADHIRKVALMARLRPALARYPFRELGRLSHAEVAQELREALVFLSGGHPEGFGLPLAEALACGCLVVGYHGLGGRDFALPFMHAVDVGDLLGFLDALEAEVQRFEADPAAVGAERHAASAAILQRYSPEAERERALAVWGTLAAMLTG
jgi:hypothetical protein